MAKHAPWFDVDKAGLAKQLADTPTWRLVAELLQNAWDEQSTRVTVTVAPLPRGHARITVEDDNPTGFADLAHAWTIFAPSAKANNPRQRGRFNFGEKLLLASARAASITTTTGTVTFSAAGRQVTSHRRETGSLVSVEMPIGVSVDTLVEQLSHLVPPIPTTINGVALQAPAVLDRLTAVLPTVTAHEGHFARTTRRTEVVVYVAIAGKGWIYELGIPVVETDLPWVLDVQQKVPLNRDRDNVTPAYLQALRVLAFNHLYRQLEPEQFRDDWARAAAGDPEAVPDAVDASLTARFGERRVAMDPSDLEANRLAVAHGYTVVSGGSLSAGEWKHARATTLPAGQVTPSPKPYSKDGAPLVFVTEWTRRMHHTATLARALAEYLGIGPITVCYTNTPEWGFRATFGTSKQLVINAAGFGDVIEWATPDTRVTLLSLLIHEFAHHDGSNHLEERYWRNLSDIGARITALALTRPRLFDQPD